MGIDLEAKTGIKVRVGCDLCDSKGTLGRVLAAETLMADLDEKVKSKVALELIANTDIFKIANECDGFELTSRSDSIQNLLQAGVIDSIVAIETLRV